MVFQQDMAEQALPLIFQALLFRMQAGAAAAQTQTYPFPMAVLVAVAAAQALLDWLQVRASQTLVGVVAVQVRTQALLNMVHQEALAS
jgi:hypothetical protein